MLLHHKCMLYYGRFLVSFIYSHVYSYLLYLLYLIFCGNIFKRKKNYKQITEMKCTPYIILSYPWI